VIAFGYVLIAKPDGINPIETAGNARSNASKLDSTISVFTLPADRRVSYQNVRL